MVIVLPSKYTPIASGSLIKEPNEHPFDYVRKIRFHCSYMSDVENHVTWDLPDRVAALIVHCLPDHEPYLAVKQRFLTFIYLVELQTMHVIKMCMVNGVSMETILSGTWKGSRGTIAKSIIFLYLLIISLCLKYLRLLFLK